MIALIQQYYRSPDPDRQVEIDTCLHHNLANEAIGKIHLLTEEPFCFDSFPDAEKITQTVIGERLSFERAFRHANRADPEGRHIWLLANADIWFDGSLGNLSAADLNGVVFALTRHEIRQDGTIEMMIPEFAHGSQDAWVFKTPFLVDRLDSAFFLGLPGCDNRIAHELIAAGYKVLNPSKKIIACHLDLKRSASIIERDLEYSRRSSSPEEEQNRFVPPPYQRHLYPIDQTDPNAFPVYRSYMQHLSEQGDLIRARDAQIERQAEQITEQGRHLADLYLEIERLARECETMRSSWGWKIATRWEKINLLKKNKNLRTNTSSETVLATHTANPQATKKSVLLVIANYDFSANADDLKIRLSPYFDTLLIDNSSPTPPTGADLILPNNQYTGLWNAAVRLALERQTEWLFFIAADIQIPTPERLAKCVEQVINKRSIGVYTPSLQRDSRAYFTACFGRDSGKLRECFMVEGFCFLARTAILKKLYPVDMALNSYGWGIDLMTAYHAYRSGYKVMVDDRVSIYHPASIHITSSTIPQEQQIRYVGIEGRDFQAWADERLKHEHELGEKFCRLSAKLIYLFMRTRDKLIKQS